MNRRDDIAPPRRAASCLEASQIAEMRWPGCKQLFVDKPEVEFLRNGRWHREVLMEYIAELEPGQELSFRAAEHDGVVFILAAIPREGGRGDSP